MREKWDFKSAEAGLTLVRAACDYHRAYADDPTVVRDLIAAGVPPDVHDSRARSALECVAAGKDRETVILLLEAGATKGHPELKNEALSSAAQAGDLELVRFLLKYGADPNATWRDTQTILMNAAMSDAPEVVAEILKYHPDLNARGPDQHTALFFASEVQYFPRTADERETREKKRGEVVAMLLKAGADPHLADKDGDTPLHKAQVVSVAEALIKNGADVNARNNRGETPLMATYSEEIARLLVQSGADISARDNEGHTALDRARSSGFQDKVKVLQAAQKQTPGKPDQ
jgi:ankyrin repeat protein